VSAIFEETFVGENVTYRRHRWYDSRSSWWDDGMME
jgi:hypothetical protein